MASKFAWRGLIAILSWCIPLTVATSPSFAQKATARITFLVGQVTVKGPKQASRAPAVLKQTLNPGDAIQTGRKSRAEITLSENRGVLRLEEQSLLVLLRTEESDSAQKKETRLKIGRAWISFRSLEKIGGLKERKREFHLSSPVAVAGVRGTIYRMDVSPDSTTQVRVYEGQVQVGWMPYQTFAPGQTILQEPTEVAGPQEVTAVQWVELIRTGQQGTFTPDRKVTISEFDVAKDAQDEWVKWNQARDKRE